MGECNRQFHKWVFLSEACIPFDMAITLAFRSGKLVAKSGKSQGILNEDLRGNHDSKRAID